MANVTFRLFSLLLPLLLGYFLKRGRFFGPEDYRVVVKIIMNITLPCAVIQSFYGFQMDLALLSLTFTGFFANWVMALLALGLSRKQGKKERMLDMLCASGFNLGNFMLPFTQQFIGGTGVALQSLFDVGNSMMCTGGTYVFGAGVLKLDGKKMGIKGILSKLAHSTPLVTYLVMILLAVSQVPIPEWVATVTQPTGAANGFLSMFMIGMMFEIRFDEAYRKTAVSVLAKRYACGTVMALLFYFVLPFDLPARQILTVCAFAPVPSMAAVYTEQVGGDVGLASFVTSCSFVISGVIVVALILGMGLGA